MSLILGNAPDNKPCYKAHFLTKITLIKIYITDEEYVA